MNNTFRKVYRLTTKIFLFLFVFTFGAVLVKFVFTASLAKAENFVFNPDFCLGGWERPQNASGVPNLQANSNSELFDKSNSAFLESSVASQIFCGYFNVEDKTRPASSVSVSFNWAMKFKNLQNSIPSEVIIIPPADSPKQAEVKVESTIQESVSQTLPNTESVKPEFEKTPVTPDSQKQDSTPAANTPVDATPSQAPAQSAPASIDSNAQSFLRLFAKTAFADGSSSDFLDISYSIDGIRWNSVGRVNKQNWKNFKVNIPLTSWEDLKKIQIMVNTIPTLEEKPEIYLESVDLVVDYDRNISEVAKDSLDNAGSVIGSVMDVIQERIVTIVSDVPQPVKEAKIETKAPTIIKEKKLVFSLVGKTIPSEKVLPWYSEDFKKEVAKKDKAFFDPELKLSDDKKSLSIQGDCEQKYFVVLLFKRESDYINKPGTFGANVAEECKGGKFSYDLENLPKDTPVGTYYLIIGEQDETNPWVPASGLIPVNIESVVEERIVND